MQRENEIREAASKFLHCLQVMSIELYCSFDVLGFRTSMILELASIVLPLYLEWRISL